MFLRASIDSHMLAVLLLAGPGLSAPVYGRAALADIKQYGVAVRVACTGELEQHQEAFENHIRRRLEGRGIQVQAEGSVVLRLLVTCIRSNDGYFVAHLRMDLAQAAHLASNNQLVDAPTWDAWKMGEYREEDLLAEVDDLTRQFLNDYVAEN